ncbi:MAG: hypothetical protein JKY65_07815 [Planctomycetes bacterium]|nr:hypothetical protein [Planctomycetota bacterium]
MALLLLVGLGLSGCFEVEDEWVLNPDGSGKVTRVVTLKPRGKPATVWAKLGMRRAKGVDAWADFKSETLEDGRLRLQATAYFKDLNTVDFKLGPQPYWGPAAGGERRIELSDQDPAKSVSAAPSADRALATKRMNFLKRVLRAYRGAKSATFRTRLRLSGEVSQASGLKGGKGGTLDAELSLARIYETLEPLLEDPDFLLERGPRRLLGPVVNKKAFGGTLGAVVKAGKPLFDYAKESAAARAKSDRILDEVGVDAVAGGRPLRLLRARVTSLTYLRSKRAAPSNMRYTLHEFQPHMRLRLRFKFNGRPIAVEGVELDSAKALKGTELRLEKFAKFHKVELDDEDKSIADADLILDYPPRGFRGLGKISGNVRIWIATETKDQDLGFTKIAAGESTADSEIRSVSGGWVTIVCATIKASDIQSVHFVTSAGKKIKAQVLSSFDRHEGSQVMVKAPRKVKSGEPLRVVFSLYADKALVELPFELEGIDPTGAPVQKKKKK